MDAVFQLVAGGGVGVIAVILIIRELKPILLNGRAKNGSTSSQKSAGGYCREDIRHHIERAEDAKAARDGVMIEKMNEQTKILLSIDKTQALMCQKMDLLNGRN